MAVKNARLGGQVFEVISWGQYINNPDSYDKHYAVDIGDGSVYPIRGRTDIRPGMYADDVMAYFKPPVGGEERSQYSSSNIIDFGNARDYADVIDLCKQRSEDERVVLSVVNSMTVPEISRDDSPEMVGLKQAIISKHIDLDSYSYRFGANYNNNKRLLTKHTISIAKLREFFDALDINAKLTISDRSEDVPNPMGHDIVVDLTSDGGEFDE